MCIYYFLCEAIFDSRIAYLLSFAHGPSYLHIRLRAVKIISATDLYQHDSGELWVMFFVWHALSDCRCFHNNNFGNDAPRLRSATTGAMQQDARRLYEGVLVVTCWHLELTKLGKCLHHFTIDVWVYDCMLACSSLLAQVCNLHTFIYWRPAHDYFWEVYRKGSD